MKLRMSEVYAAWAAKHPDRPVQSTSWDELSEFMDHEFPGWKVLEDDLPGKKKPGAVRHPVVIGLRVVKGGPAK